MMHSVFLYDAFAVRHIDLTFAEMEAKSSPDGIRVAKTAVDTETTTGENWVFSLSHEDDYSNAVDSLNDAEYTTVLANNGHGGHNFDVFTILWSKDGQGEIDAIHAGEKFFDKISPNDITAMRMLLSHNHIPVDFVGQVLTEFGWNRITIFPSTSSDRY